MADVTGIISTVSAAIAAAAALATLVVAFLTLREGRSTISELRKLAAEASKETAAQERIVSASHTTAAVLNAVFMEAQASREVDNLVRVRAALAEMAAASQRVVDGQPQFVFYSARQTLRAALVAIRDAEYRLPVCQRMSTDDSVAYARRYELEADAEVSKLLTAAWKRLDDALRSADEAMRNLRLFEHDPPGGKSRA